MIKEISWEELYFIWKNNLWPNRVSPIESMSCMCFNGGKDATIFEKYDLIHLGYFDNNKIISVYSGHRTSKDYFRGRGIWVHENYRNRRIAKKIMKEIEKYAINENCNSFINGQILRNDNDVFIKILSFEWLDKYSTLEKYYYFDKETGNCYYANFYNNRINHEDLETLFNKHNFLTIKRFYPKKHYDNILNCTIFEKT